MNRFRLFVPSLHCQKTKNAEHLKRLQTLNKHKYDSEVAGCFCPVTVGLRAWIGKFISLTLVLI